MSYKLDIGSKSAGLKTRHYVRVFAVAALPYVEECLRKASNSAAFIVTTPVGR